MNTVNQIHKCNVCGNIVNFVHAGGGELVCCGKPMMLISENTQENVALEKHMPVVTQTATGIDVFIGEVEHPMEAAHYIEWIEMITEDGKDYRKDLHPGQKPAASFCTKAKKMTVREYCNLHGLWKIEVSL
jgi:superoxide reductase